MRSQDLIWQPAINSTSRASAIAMIDLMAWNADGTAHAWRMHRVPVPPVPRQRVGEQTVPGGWQADPFVGHPRCRCSWWAPTDHVAPWKSVWVDNLVRSGRLPFLLTAGGHNAGIVCGLVHPKRRYRIATRRLVDPHLAPGDQVESATRHEGAWWPVWQQWLAKRSSGARSSRQRWCCPQGHMAWSEDAPGQYIRQC